jgi:hypothetical protein
MEVLKGGADIAPHIDMSDEQAGELAALREAADMPLVEQPAPIDEAAAWAALPQMLGGMLAIAFPDVQKVYTPESCRAWGEAMLPVAKKYGWTIEGMMSCEIALAIATLPLAIGTYQAMKQSRDKAEKAGEKQAGRGAQAANDGGGGVGFEPGLKTVVFGSGVSS